jgi:calcineurin-like phosphoesterase family protein
VTNHFVVSDQHFNHVNILGFKDEAGKLFRGDLFKDVDHMNETMIDNHNRLVMPRDHVWFLGDVFFGSVEKADMILSRMNGKKRLTPGNHDYLSKHKDFYHKHFEKIELWNLPEHRVDGNRIVMSHVPIHETSFGKASFNVHGHTHQQKNISPVHVNVSVEKTNYAPVPLDDVLRYQGIHR